MNQEEANIRRSMNAEEIFIDYSDDDIIVMDNIKQVATPDPIRLQMNTIAACMNGREQVDVNGKTVQIAKNELLLTPPNVVFDNYLFYSDFECKIICMTNKIMQGFLREKMNIWNEVLYIHKMNVIMMDAQDLEFFARFYDLLRLCIDADHKPIYRTEVIQSLLRGAVIGLCGALRQKMPENAPMQIHHTDSLFQRFLDLVGHSEIKRRSVEYYANCLCISPKYLSTICKKSSGKTANDWITEYTLEDIRYYLHSTDMSIKEISNVLGFPNPSFFGRYVKEHFGLPPMQIRQKNRKSRL